LTPVRLSRSSWAVSARPVRIVHLGIGNFSRAHQAWYTQTVDPERAWGIAAFTGRRPDMAHALAPQGGLYTLIERGPVSDQLTVIDVVQNVRPAADLDGLLEIVAAPATSLITLTVTEAGYRSTDTEPAGSSLGRLALALMTRYRRGGGPLAIVSCDNLQANGSVLRERVLSLADQIDSGSAAWVDREVAFVSTSVDRITPPADAQDRLVVERELGLSDQAPVVCEPFSDWVLCGDFPGGRPNWGDAGARFVDEIEPWERRKLWILNGGHSLLAYLGIARGHRSVADAVSDPELSEALNAFWDLVERLLPTDLLGIATYRGQLLERFAQSRIAYPLSQIAGDGLEKLRNRVVPVIEAAQQRGDSAEPAMRILLAWTRWLIDEPGRVTTDQNAHLLRDALTAGSELDQTVGLIKLLAPGLAAAVTNDR
jgi:fructuronate reductase